MLRIDFYLNSQIKAGLRLDLSFYKSRERDKVLKRHVRLMPEKAFPENKMFLPFTVDRIKIYRTYSATETAIIVTSTKVLSSEHENKQPLTEGSDWKSN